MDISWSKSSTCRICLNEFDDLNSLDDYSDFLLVIDLLTVNKIFLHHQNLPEKCCNACLKELKASYDFKLKCDHSNDIFIEYFNKFPTLLADQSTEEDKASEIDEEIIETYNLSTTSILEGCEPIIDYRKCLVTDCGYDILNFKSPFRAIALDNEIQSKVETILENKLKTLSVVENIRIKQPLFDLHGKINLSRDSLNCKICKFIAPYPSALSSHSRTHTVNMKKVFPCKACPKKFNGISNLNKHKLLHADDPQYTCDSCKKEFTFRTSLLEHLATHADEKFVCETCKKNFTSKVHLDSHSRRHIRDGKFICDICGKKRISKHNLDIHKRVHSGHHQYLCKDCSYRTVSRGGLQIHERLHSGEKPFDCTECEERFISSLQMKRHIIKKHWKKI